MSLLLWDPILGGGRRRYNPWAVAPRHYHIPDPLELAQRQLEQMDRMVDQFFDTDMNIQLRDNVGRLSVSDRGDLTYQVDVSGYRPEELKVEMQGNELVLQGEHKEQNQGESVHRQFVRRLLIPEDINRESIKCDLSTDGRLCVTGKKQQGELPRSIPIQIGMGSQQAAIGGQQQQKQQPEAIEQDQQQVKQQNGPANVGQQQAQKAH